VISVIADNSVCQAVLSALQTAGATQEKLVISTCTAKSVVDAVGPALDGATLFDNGARTGDDAEAKLYRAVMKTYAPSADPNGLATGGYIAMLGFIRAVNAGGLTGEPTVAAITTAIKGAKNVPLPLGQSKTFSCDTNSIPSPLFKAVVCNSKVFVTPLKNAEPTTYTVIDPGPLFAP
jgi:branched-chain amino acid transport system substrate-binding protein